MLVKLGKIMLKMRKLKHVEEKNFSFGKCVDVEKMDDIIKLEGGRTYGYKCIK